MRVDMWSDIVCPFCWLGRRRLEAAAQAEGVALELHWRAYELDPDRKETREPGLVKAIAKKYGLTLEDSRAGQERLAEAFAQFGGLYDFEGARRANSFDGHRLTRLAAETGRADAMQAALMRAYFSDGEDIADHATLTRLAESVGLKSDEIADLLGSTLYGDDVRRDEAIAIHQLGVQGVPFFVFVGKLAVAGAQPVETFRDILRDLKAQGA